MSVHHRRVQLKIKVKSLAAEARIIRAEVRKQGAWGNQLIACSLREHRVQVVRPTVREAHLAACFLRGTPYALCEFRTLNPPNFESLAKFICRFCSMAADDPALTAWVQEAEAHLQRPQPVQAAA